MDRSLLRQYKEWEEKVSAYVMAVKLLEIDAQTIAPAKGLNYRNRRLKCLNGELYSLYTDRDQAEVRRKLLESEKTDVTTRTAITLYEREIGKTSSIPRDLYVAYAALRHEAYRFWLRARRKNDYAVFKPYLKSMIDMKREIYGHRAGGKTVYDRMLNDYEPGTDTRFYDSFFAAVKKELLPLIRKVQRAPVIADDFIFQEYPVEKQKIFMEGLLKYLGFDSSWGYQGETEHPFTDWLCENDCRITTRYLEKNVASAVFSTVHESGHAWYEHDIDPRYDGTILSEGVSSGMHESQSRLCEVYLGRSEAFWEANYGRLQKIFPDQLGEVTVHDFVRAVNSSKSGLIRTEADELTYPVHILIRYELEKNLFNGKLTADDLEPAWNALYRKYLHVSCTEDNTGILQDVHWSDGDFGYFPAYALGDAFAAQFYQAMCGKLDVNDCLRTGRYKDIMAWLRENVHQYGCFYSSFDVIRKATGEDFNMKYYIGHLKEKYSRLYKLS